jgi:tripartite-type tricarboxylate transporter receptor subunit TctC
MVHIDRRHALGGALASLAALRVRTVQAQAQYPDRPIRVIVPFAGGGSRRYGDAGSRSQNGAETRSEARH